MNFKACTPDWSTYLRELSLLWIFVNEAEFRGFSTFCGEPCQRGVPSLLARLWPCDSGAMFFTSELFRGNYVCIEFQQAFVGWCWSAWIAYRPGMETRILPKESNSIITNTQCYSCVL